MLIARTDSSRRRYTEAQIRDFLGLRNTASEPTRVVAYCRVSSAAQKPDLLTQFGFAWFEHYAKQNNCDILVLNQERLSPEQEMVQDLMTIVHDCSLRLYGLRNYRKKLNEALRKDANHESV